jgi:hypothetical protein
MSDKNKTSVSKNIKYQNTMYVRRQMRDTIGGTNDIKSSNELYLPMPSHWLDVEVAPSSQNSVNTRVRPKLPPDYIPWNHPNPAYRAYLQRARFPDITAATLRGMLGIALRAPSKIDMPAGMEQFEDEICPDGESLEEFYGYCLSEVFTVGNINIVVDVDSDGEFFITSYTSESTPDWGERRIIGKNVIEEVCFAESEDVYLMTDEKQKYKRYQLSENDKPEFVDIDGVEEGVPIPLLYRGKPFEQIPVFPAGSVENSLAPQTIPLMGVSDIAIAIYQETADLRQAHYLTCNPTLFIFGVGQKEVPSVVGSSVIVGITNPQGRAEYTQTDTSALDHMEKYIQNLKSEAVAYGANFIASQSRESGEALGIRKAGQGASLVRVVSQVGKAINSALNFIAKMKGISVDWDMFQPNTEFAETSFTSQDLTALVNAWMSGAIDHDTLLDNMRNAGYIKDDKTNDEVKDNIEAEPPKLAHGAEGEDDSEGDGEEKPEDDKGEDQETEKKPTPKGE